MGAGKRVAETTNGLSSVEGALRAAIREAAACDGYAREAEAVGDGQLAAFFYDARGMHEKVAEEARRVISARSGESFDGDPDPGDVSPAREG